MNLKRTVFIFSNHFCEYIFYISFILTCIFKYFYMIYIGINKMLLVVNTCRFIILLVLNFKELKQKRIQNKNKKQIQVGFHRWLVYFKFIQIISYSGQYLFLVINC